MTMTVKPTPSFQYRGLCTNYNGKSYKIPKILFCTELNTVPMIIQYFR